MSTRTLSPVLPFKLLTVSLYSPLVSQIHGATHVTENGPLVHAQRVLHQGSRTRSVVIDGHEGPVIVPDNPTHSRNGVSDSAELEGNRHDLLAVPKRAPNSLTHNGPRLCGSHHLIFPMANLTYTWLWDCVTTFTKVISYPSMCTWMSFTT